MVIASPKILPIAGYCNNHNCEYGLEITIEIMGLRIQLGQYQYHNDTVEATKYSEKSVGLPFWRSVIHFASHQHLLDE